MKGKGASEAAGRDGVLIVIKDYTIIKTKTKIKIYKEDKIKFIN